MREKQTAREKLLDITFEEVYMNGYAATSVDTILKKAGVPKGSMYHHFKSKKELALAMVQEKLFVKMDIFFNFEKEEGKTVLEGFRKTLVSISKNELLVTYGCPLYRLMVELSATDEEFDTLLTSKAIQMQKGVSSLLQMGIDDGEFSSKLNSDQFSKYVLSAVWGVLSLSPSLSSSTNFIQQTSFIVKELENYHN